MKTKEVIIEGWASVYETTYDNGRNIYIYPNKNDPYDKAIYSNVRCKVILEIEEIGKIVYPSDFEKIWNDEIVGKGDIFPSKQSKSFKVVKNKLFGEDKNEIS